MTVVILVDKEEHRSKNFLLVQIYLSSRQQCMQRFFVYREVVGDKLRRLIVPLDNPPSCTQATTSRLNGQTTRTADQKVEAASPLAGHMLLFI